MKYWQSYSKDAMPQSLEVWCPPPLGDQETHQTKSIFGQSNELLVPGGTDVQPNGQQSLQSCHNQRCLHRIAVPFALHFLPLLIRNGCLQIKEEFWDVHSCFLHSVLPIFFNKSWPHFPCFLPVLIFRNTNHSEKAIFSSQQFFSFTSSFYSSYIFTINSWYFNSHVIFR